MVVKVDPEGKNQATWVLIAPFLLLALHAAVFMDALLIPVIVFPVITALILWRGRGRLPEVLRRLRSLLAANEAVLGDGIGVPREDVAGATPSDWSS
jgi:hypothetical protein